MRHSVALQWIQPRDRKTMNKANSRGSPAYPVANIHSCNRFEIFKHDTSVRDGKWLPINRLQWVVPHYKTYQICIWITSCLNSGASVLLFKVTLMVCFFNVQERKRGRKSENKITKFNQNNTQYFYLIPSELKIFIISVQRGTLHEWWLFKLQCFTTSFNCVFNVI